MPKRTEVTKDDGNSIENEINKRNAVAEKTEAKKQTIKVNPIKESFMKRFGEFIDETKAQIRVKSVKTDMGKEDIVYAIFTDADKPDVEENTATIKDILFKSHRYNEKGEIFEILSIIEGIEGVDILSYRRIKLT